MKKLFFLSLFLITGLANSLFADICCPKPVKDPCFDDSDLFRKNACVIFASGEFLYWRADAGALEYAFQYDQAPTTATSYGLGEYKIADYEYDPGFRIAFGWYNAPKYWQVYGQFTWMRITSSDSENRTSTANQPLVGTFPQVGVLGNELQSASSRLKLNHELADLLVSRVFITNPHLRLRLFGGITGGRIQQKWNVSYIDLTSQKENIFNKWKFVGIGFKLGLDIDWFWGHNFYLTGKLSTAPLVGKHRYTASINQSSSTYEDIKYSKYRGAYNVDAYLGPSYQKSFDCGRMEAFVGYELDGWFNVHEVIRPSSVALANVLTTEITADVNNGYFLMHGLTARLTIDF